MNALNLLVVGVGGQGVVLASDIIAETAMSAGYDVKKTDTLGMAQRGGSVVSHVRMGPKVHSPLIPEGEVDVLLGFEKLEAARWCPYLKTGGVAVINNQAVPPLSVGLGREKYPSDEQIQSIFRLITDRVYLIDGEERARSLGNVKTLNIFMLGCVSAFMPLPEDKWKECIAAALPQKVRDINLAAFDLGRKEVVGVGI